MLSGIPKKKKNQADMLTQKESIEEQALKRFMEASSKDTAKRGLPVSDEIKMATRKSLIDQSDPIALERIMGGNDLLPIAYLETGLRLSESVCRIVIKNRAGIVVGYGTGFLVSPDIVLTNNHVIPDIETAVFAAAEFNYQHDENFKPCRVYEFAFEPNRFFITDARLDFTLVSLNSKSSSGKKLNEIPYIKLLPIVGKIIEGEYVSIIQHPNGGPKAVTLRENKVQFLFDDFVHYMTDTEPGSSGSPVFNDQWIAVALHHSGVPDPKKKGNWIANEGIRISSIASFVESEYQKADDETKRIIKEVFENLKDPDKKNNIDDDKKTNKKNLGYDPIFLGENFRIDLPKLTEQMEEDSAKKRNGSNLLDYVHFSIVMCKSRGLAYYTVVNIDGNKSVKVPRGEKGDAWKYDSKIAQKYQYGEEVYADNPLDRGHLVRRLDPCWGEDAIQANFDTFHYTNCAPQHKDLNQKIWL